MVSDGLVMAGVGMLIGALWWLSPPIAVAAAGLMLILLGMLRHYRGKDPR